MDPRAVGGLDVLREMVQQAEAEVLRLKLAANAFARTLGLAEPYNASGQEADLATRIAFYESVMMGQPCHHYNGRVCKVAVAKEAMCCNPAYNGLWGTNCWCCHGLWYAADASYEEMVAHLQFKGPAEKKP